jgi:ABC-2 type transport system permease protein
MRNVLALARKELRSYFSSPIGYVVIGVFALLFGFMFYSFLIFFMERSMGMAQFGMGGPQSVNVNQMMIRPLLLQTSIIVLFVLPMLTMRTFSEEKRTGTIELLMTSPLTDWEIILGKFLGAVALYALMLAVTALSLVWLFVYGNPEWRQIAVAYLGLLLLGCTFIALGLFISNFTRNQVVAGFITFAVFLMLLLVNWLGDSAGPRMREVISALSIFQHFEDFTKGILDTKHLVYYASAIAFGLFLTARTVDADRWRG